MSRRAVPMALLFLFLEKLEWGRTLRTLTTLRTLKSNDTREGRKKRAAHWTARRYLPEGNYALCIISREL